MEGRRPAGTSELLLPINGLGGVSDRADLRAPGASMIFCNENHLIFADFSQKLPRFSKEFTKFSKKFTKFLKNLPTFTNVFKVAYLA